MELFLLYLWMTLDSLHTVLWVVIGVNGFLIIASVFVFLIGDLDWKDVKRPIFSLVCLFLILGTIKTFLPTQKMVAVLVAGHYALKVADTPEASKVLGVLRKKANEYLDEQLKETVK